MVSASADEALVDRVYVDTITYSMTIDGGQTHAITNEKLPSNPSKPSRPTGQSINASARKQVAKSTLPRTGDDSVAPTLQLIALSLGIGGLGLVLRRWSI
ncbi:MAG: LPXTG cell wall anchor domain-containing protein [Atopobiaceae bacterium]|nr:LPXTG cell wall anchor domain-containing protein [Atopobiaceae bacterium]